MRVLQVMASGLHGGAELFFEDLVPALARAGLTQSAVIRPYPTRAAKLAAADVPSAMLRFGGPLDLISRWGTAKQARAWKPDLILGWMNRACANLPRGPWMNIGRLGGYYDLKYYRRCTHLICNTPQIADHVIRHGWAAARTHYIPNFCAVDPAPAISPEALGTSRGVPILLVLARLQPAKGIDTAIRALAHVSDAVLWIAGDGPLLGRLQKLAAEAGVSARVRFLGWRDDRAALLKAATMVLVPSRHEPFGNVVVNAWAHGVPLIAARSEGPGYLVQDGIDGLLVPVDAPEAMAGAIKRLIADPALAQGLAAAGRRRAAGEFSESAVVRRYLEVFAAVRP